MRCHRDAGGPAAGLLRGPAAGLFRGLAVGLLRGTGGWAADLLSNGQVGAKAAVAEPDT